MKSLIFIIAFRFYFSTSALPLDTIKLVKIKYFNTHPPFPLPCPYIGDCYHSEWDLGEFMKSFRYDTIVENKTLGIIDSILKLSPCFQLALKDTSQPIYHRNVAVNRAIIFTYQKRDVFLSDNGNWEYDFRFKFRDLFNRKDIKIRHKKLKNKYVRINGIKMRYDPKLRAAIELIKKHLACGWCVL